MSPSSFWLSRAVPSEVCGTPTACLSLPPLSESLAQKWKSYWLAAKWVLKFILSTSPSVLFLARVTNKGEGTNYVGGLQLKRLKLKQKISCQGGFLNNSIQVCCINLASAMNWGVLLIFGLKILIILGGNAPRKCIVKTKQTCGCKLNLVFVSSILLSERARAPRSRKE